METDFLSHKVRVDNTSVIDRLRRNGIEYVYIKPRNEEIRKLDDLLEGKSSEIINELKEQAPAFQLNLKDLSHASEVYSESVFIVGSILDGIRNGGAINTEAVKHVSQSITEMTLKKRGVLTSITKLKQYDNYTFHHSINVSIFAASLATHLGMSKKEIEIAANSGLIHDIGKMLVPESILNKPGKLSEEEYKVMKTHVIRGYEYAKKCGTPAEELKMIIEHHERHDGSGYPYGLKDEQISIFGKIGAVVDIYDAMTSDRVYHKGIAATSALKLMFQWTDKHINKSIFEFFIKNVGIYPVGSLVIMATHEIGIVGKMNPANPMSPVVVVFLSKNGSRMPIKVVDLSKSGIDAQKIIGLINPENVSVPPEVYKYIDNMNTLA
ncbi:MAG: HD-GYP domain-containing protein [Seleniivibrio sp.]|nr:HD-GYP domain-containing protein [Seleniivibrio sp.]